MLALAQFYNWSGDYRFSRQLLINLFDDLVVAMSFHLNLDTIKMVDIMKQDKDRRCMLKIVCAYMN